MSGTWIGKDDAEFVRDLNEALDAITAAAVNEQRGLMAQEKLDVACWHLMQALKRLDEAGFGKPAEGAE